MFQRSRAMALLIFTLCAAVALGAGPLQMSVRPAFEGYTPSFGTIPVVVELQNNGQDVRGVVQVSAEDFQMEYPVELPRGTHKRLLTYPNVTYSGLQYTLATDHGTVSKAFHLPSMAPDGTSSALLIGDNAGEMAFIRGEEKKGSSSGSTGVQDEYSTPEDAPGRAVAYANISTVVLGPGAERLSTESVEALKLYAITGGALVFLGGASSPILGDPRWADTLPAQDFQPQNLSHSNVLRSLGGYEPPEVSVMSGTPIRGAATRMDGTILMTAERTIGLGRVVYAAFNPFEPPLSKWEGRRAAMNKIMRVVDASRVGIFLGQERGPSPYVPGVSYGSTTYSSFSSTYSATPRPGDPFSTKLPSTERVFFLLGAYFIAVVPLNFLVLRKFKRGELAWVTAPLISLGFASAFFASAQSLYSAKMSTASQGILIGQEGMNEGMFVGVSQLFVPRSGSYDLKVHDIDSLAVVSSNSMYGRYGGPSAGDTSAELNPVDVGEIKIPEMKANNLAFKQISYRQKVDLGSWFKFSIERKGERRGTATIQNTSPFRIDDAALYVGDARFPIGSFPSGETKSIPFDLDLGGGQQIGPGDVAQFFVRNRNFAVCGNVTDFHPGPQIGEPVPARNSINIAFVAKEALGPQ